MDFSKFSHSKSEEQKAVSPLPPFVLPLREGETSNISLELSSTASTDTDSSLSIGVDEERGSPQAVDPVDLESPFGKLRHRTVHHHENDDVFAVDDSDSEHGLLPRRRRKANASFKQYLFYALATLVGLSTLRTLQSSFVTRKETAEWKHFKRHTMPMVKKAFKKYLPEDQYTIVLRGGRLDLLQQSLDSFSRCSSVKQVQVDYQGGNTLPVTLLKHESHKVVPKTETTPTSAVFLLSEGVIIS
ncbi:MAG: hypothetical protein SGARI_003303, partial [Bacillariaceae sp.]